MPGTGVWNFNAPRNVNTSDPVVGATRWQMNHNPFLGCLFICKTITVPPRFQNQY